LIDYAIVIQARMGSSRRPEKINYNIDGEPMLSYQINRLKSFGYRDIIVATTLNRRDDITADIAKSCGVNLFRGSESDVLNRFANCCREYDIKNVIRVGGDDPLIDPEGIAKLIELHKNNSDIDFLYSSHKKGWIYGTASELLSAKSLYIADKRAKREIEREHIIPYYKDNSTIPQKRLYTPESIRRDDIYLSVDYQEDLDLIEQIIEHFAKSGKKYNFNQRELIFLYDSGDLEINNRHLHSGFDD